jgi:hypothetical protein
MFALPFDEIAQIAGRSPAAVRQLASRARKRVQGAPSTPPSDLARQRGIVEAYLTAVRAGDLAALVSVLDPHVEIHADTVAAAGGVAGVVHGAQDAARQALVASRAAPLARLALVDGTVGVIVAPYGQLTRALRFTVVADRITRIEVVGEPERLARISLAVL